MVELRPRGDNTGPTLNKNNRVKRNFNQSDSGNFNRERKNDGYNCRPTLRTVTEDLEGEPIGFPFPTSRGHQIY